MRADRTLTAAVRGPDRNGRPRDRQRGQPPPRPRALNLPSVAENRFTDVSGTHAANVNALAQAGVTRGCNPEGILFCPADLVTRAQMGSFLARALGIDPILGDRFDDVSGVHEANISAIADNGITLGCNPEGTFYCPNDIVTRGQMAAFLHRAIES